MFNNFKKISKTVIIATLISVSTFASITPISAKPVPPPPPKPTMDDMDKCEHIATDWSKCTKNGVKYDCQESDKTCVKGDLRPITPTPSRPVIRQVLSPDAQTGQIQVRP